MCGRFNVTSTPGLQALLASLGSDLVLPAPAYNVAPTERVSLLQHSGDRELVVSEARWWLTPRWAKAVNQKYSMFNARCESLSTSRAYRRPFASQRGILPMSSFMEWRGTAGNKQPWLITNADEALAVAALWEIWSGADVPLLSCTIVTTTAAPEFLPWHSRMPVMLAPQEREAWLDNRRLIAIDDPVFRGELKEDLVLLPLSPAMGNARNKGEAAMQPIGESVYLSRA